MVQHPVGAGHHLLGGAGLVRLRSELIRLLLQRGGLLLRVGPFPTSTRLVQGAGVQVLLPPHVVDIRLGADGVEEPHPVADCLDELDVVGDHDQPTLVLGEKVLQPGDGIRVQVVGRLVEQQGGFGSPGAGRGGEEDLGELHAAALSTREGLQLLVEHSFRQSQRVADAGGFGVGLVATQRVVLLLQPGVHADRSIALGVRRRGLHDLLLALHGLTNPVEPAGREDAVPGRLLDVPFLRVLRQVAQLPGTDDTAAIRLGLPRQDPHRGGLPCPVAAHQRDAVARLHPQVLAGGGEEGARAHPNFQILRHNHRQYPNTARPLARLGA